MTDKPTVTTDAPADLHHKTVSYIAKWIRQIYIPASSIGDNLHIADCIEGMVPRERDGTERRRIYDERS